MFVDRGRQRTIGASAIARQAQRLKDRTIEGNDKPPKDHYLATASSGWPQQATAHGDQPPLPERNPVHAGASALRTSSSSGWLPTKPWSDAEVAAAKAKCTEALSSIKLNYEPLAPIKQGLCEAPAPILLKSLGSDTKVEIDPPPQSLARW